MKKTFLKLPKQPVRFAPSTLGRRLGFRAGTDHFHSAAFRTDAEIAADEAALLEKVRNKAIEAAKTEIETRAYQNAEQVTSIVNTVLANMPLDALRKYNDDKTTLETNIRNIAAEVEKINQRSTAAADAKTSVILEAMDSKIPGTEETPWQRIEKAMRSKGQDAPKGYDLFKLNVRAAANMTLGNTTDETTFSVPVTIVESMSMAEFAGKRYGVQFISNIADRTVVQEITQYKTWLEEGTEQGSFAIVAEGAVKPLVSTSLVRNFAAAKKVAGKYVITEEFAKFRQDAYNIIRRLINDKMIRDYTALLVVDLNAQAAAYVGTSLDGTIATPTDYDAIGAAAAQIESLNFNPDVLVIHPQDKWRLALEKDSQGRYYMMIPMTGPDGVTRMMGFLVVTSTYQTLGSFTLGESGLFKIEEEPVTIRMGYGIDVTVTSGNVTAVSADFDNNRMRLIVETWFNDWLPTPYIGSFVKAAFVTIKAALAA
jgi:hypothetical protein